MVLAATGPAAPVAAEGAARPNVVVVETDDQTVADLDSMPRTRELIGDAGVTFDHSVVSLSQCCPSRATFLTGRYAHTHGVRSALPPAGGFDAFDDDESLAVWLRRAGYRTALVGKYMNGYGRDDPTYVPPAWTEWHGLLGPTTYRFFGFDVNHDGVPRHHPSGYQTDVLTALGEDVIRRRAASDAPLFLWMTYVAPHEGSPNGLFEPWREGTTVASPLYRGASFGARPPATPAFDEADVSDKPRAIRRRPRLGPRARARIAAAWRERQDALRSVDDGVARLVAALRDAGALDRTLIVFTSDNGFLSGEHRVGAGKVHPYEPSIRVPLLMRGPGVPVGERRSQLVWNGDLAPTILAAAGARAPWPADGRSLWPVLRDPRAPGAEAVLLEGPSTPATGFRAQFVGVRTPRHTYVEHPTGEVELYDLARDPHQLQNLARREGVAALRTRLARRLRELRRCAGTACRGR